MLRLITDFDGPIADVSIRYYTVYNQCLDRVARPGQWLNRLSYEEFWQCKRARIPEWKIGLKSGLDEPQAQVFAKMRGMTVHAEPYLHHDQPISGAIEALTKARNAGLDIVVMTMRRTRELDEALNRCQLGHFFPADRRYCLSNDHIKIGDTKDKPLLMQRALKELPPAEKTWMVGDTEADIIAAQTGGVTSIGVLSGIRDREQLSKYNPDFILKNLAEAVDFILASVQVSDQIAPQSLQTPAIVPNTSASPTPAGSTPNVTPQTTPQTTPQPSPSGSGLPHVTSSFAYFAPKKISV